MTRRLATYLLAACLTSPAFAHQVDGDSAHGGCARYLGNEGVLVRHADTSVLFDAFYSKSFGQYALVSDDDVAGMLAGEPPYDGVDALFVSHVHGDHFSPTPTRRFLEAQPDIRLFGTPQVAAALKQAGAGEDILERITVFDLDEDDAAALASVGDVTISVVAVPHSGGPRMADIQNLSFRVTLGDGPTVAHMGDAGVVHANFARHESHWLGVDLDVAFPPYWLLRSAAGQRIVDDFLDAGRVIGVHVPASAQGRGDALRDDLGFDVFTDPGETRRLGGETADGCVPAAAADQPAPVPSATMGD